MKLPDDLTVDRARRIVDVLVATSEAMLLEHAGIPRSMTFLALSVAAANADAAAIAAAQPRPVRLGRPVLTVVAS